MEKIKITYEASERILPVLEVEAIKAADGKC